MSTMQIDSPASLYFLHMASEDPARLAAFYRDRMAMSETMMATDGVHILKAGSRAAIISKGESAGLLCTGYAMADAQGLEALRVRLRKNDVAMQDSEGALDALYQPGAFTIRDPQQRQIAFGLPIVAKTPDAEPARLQHTVFQTTDLDNVVRFYVERLGFTISDEVVHIDDGRVMTVFMRSDNEHHSIAFFRGSRNEWDHHCYETNEWNDIRDWGDKFGKQRIPIFYGPGRHGPGNNLFFMVNDPDGNRVELSAEIETVEPGKPAGVWEHCEYTLNSWGSAWIRT
jgi:catechol 2,3-dioxygenase